MVDFIVLRHVLLYFAANVRACSTFLSGKSWHLFALFPISPFTSYLNFGICSSSQFIGNQGCKA